MNARMNGLNKWIQSSSSYVLPPCEITLSRLVVQAALFAGFLSAFLIELLGRLEPDPMDIIQDVLIYQTQMMRNSSLAPYVAPDFSPPTYIVVVNALFYASLGFMILAAFIAMLIKSWVREFDRGLRAMSLPEQRAKTREFRYLGMVGWKLPEMVGILPLLIQISLVLFSIGLILFLFYISTPSFGVTTAIFGVGILYYTMTTSISVFVTSSPFHSPLSRILSKVYQYVHAYFCLSIDDFISEPMDSTPETALGRVRRDLQVTLQKSRPYLEKDFAKPITATTMDEVQLSTAASALQRIHDSAPNAQHSQALHWSVWQIAGGTALRIPPSFDLPSWILDRYHDVEYLSHLPPAMVIAFGAVWLRASSKTYRGRVAASHAILRRVDNPNDSWSRLVIAAIGRVRSRDWYQHERVRQIDSDLIDMMRRGELQIDECLWLLSMLSELHDDEWQWQKEPFWIEICLPMLMSQASKWYLLNPPDIILLEAVVTLAATSCSPDEANWLNILTSSRERPWLLLNIRNPNLASTFFEGTPSDYHKQLISLLFLVVYGLICRRSYPLAAQYLTTITVKGDLPLYASALAAVAPVIMDDELSAIGRMLVAPHTQDLTQTFRDLESFGYDRTVGLEEMFNNYDEQLGAGENPDPNILAILLVLSNHLDIKELQGLNLELKNPSLQLTARVVARLDIPDGSGVPLDLFDDHRVHNMIAALSLLRYKQGKVTHYTESFLLASFLRSREPAIFSVALEYYMKTTIPHPDPSAPSYYLSTSVSAVFNCTLPDRQLWAGWEMLDIFVDGFERLSVEWRRTFAEGFFTLLRRPLLRLRGDMESSTPESELKEIVTWEYFHGKEPEPELTDSDFSGLDWMAMAWSLHLSQQSGRKTDSSIQRKVKWQGSSGPTVDGTFVLRALCKLLDAAPYYQIIPIMTKLREFVQWLDEIEISEYRRMISAHVERAVRKHEEFQMLNKFHKFHCILYM